jgi:hypothetical protein
MTIDSPYGKFNSVFLQNVSNFKAMQQNITSICNQMLKNQAELAFNNQSEELKAVFLRYTENHNKKIKELLTELADVFYINFSDYTDKVEPKLREYNWFLTSSMDHRLFKYIIEKVNEQTDKEAFLNKIFVTYYSSNNFRMLDYMTNNWSNNYMLSDRLPILEECVSVLKDSKSEHSNIKNPNYIVIPTLIAQIDGLMNAYVEKKKSPLNNQKIRNKNFKVSFDKYIEQNYEIDMEMATVLKKENNAASTLILDILFQPTIGIKMEELKEPFSRHKIMHGESLDYGKIENTIRLFLLMDFLAESIEDDLSRVVSAKLSPPAK